MKKVRKTMALALCLMLIVGVFSACGGKETKSNEKYTYWVSMDPAVSQTQTSYEDLIMYQEMSKATGVDVEFVHPAQGSEGGEAFQILLSSGDYPDMIEYNWSSYAGGPDQAINDGVIIALNSYLKDFAPNYYDYMEGEKGKDNNNLYKAQSISEQGNYYGFRSLSIGNMRNFGGLYIRKDMLDKWGLDIPVTIDDWTEVLKTAKENGIKAPLTGDAWMFAFGGRELFNSAWGVGKNFYVDGDEVKFGPFEKAYKDYIAKMAEWMKAGYVDPDYVTNDSTAVEGYMTNDSSIASYGFVGSSIGKLLPAMAERNPDYNVVACPMPVLKDGDLSNFAMSVSAESVEPTIAITVQCGDDNKARYEEAIKWCDYLYSDEGLLLKCFGIEGDTYTVETGEDGEKHYVYTDKITDHEKIGAHSVEAALYHFMRPANAPGFNQHPDYLKGYYPYEQQMDAAVVWNEGMDEIKKHLFPGVSYTDAEAAKIAEIKAKLDSDLNAAMSNIVLGKASIDTYDAAIKTAKDKGYGEYLKIQQAAYDRYCKVLESK